jgi:acetyl-CoA acetyltransferase
MAIATAAKQIMIDRMDIVVAGGQEVWDQPRRAG